MFRSDYAHVLPRVICYFDDLFRHAYNDDCGERLAMREFNEADRSRKIRPVHGLRYLLPRRCFHDLWPDGMYWAHFFEHPQYNLPDSLLKSVVLDIDGKTLQGRPDADWRRETGLD